MRRIFFAVFLAATFAARADSISDRFTVTLRGAGPDVLLIPGLACSNAVWDATAKRLEEHYRLHLLQLAGFAGAPARANAQGAILQPTVDAIDAYIKSSHLKAPRIIGHSLGGFLGMMLVTQHPEDASKLMVVDSLPFFSALMGATDAAAAAPQAAGLRDTILTETDAAYAQGEEQFLHALVKSPEGFKSAMAWAVKSDKSVVARAMYEIMTTDLRGKLHEIKTPVTVLYPWDAGAGLAQDMVDNLYKDNFAALPNKTLVRIDNSYHFIMFDQPVAFTAQVEAFLK